MPGPRSFIIYVEWISAYRVHPRLTSTLQTRNPTPSITPRVESANPFSSFPGLTLPSGNSLTSAASAAADSLIDALSNKLAGGAPKTPGVSGVSTPAPHIARQYQTTHHGSNAGQSRVQRRQSRSTAQRNSSRSLSSSRMDPSLNSHKFHFESNPHVSYPYVASHPSVDSVCSAMEDSRTLSRASAID